MNSNQEKDFFVIGIGASAGGIADANRYSATPIILDESVDEIEDVKVTFSFDGANLQPMLNALPRLFPVLVDQSNSAEITIRAAPPG